MGVWRPRAWTKGSGSRVAANGAENSGAPAEAKSKGFADSSSAAALRLTQLRQDFSLIPKLEG